MKESEVRKLRDAIYGPCADKNWRECKDEWMRPENVKWLVEHQPKKQ